MDYVRECYNEIGELLVPLQTSGGSDNKVRVIIDNHHTYMVSKYGPVIKYTKGDITEFKNVKKNLDIEKLKKRRVFFGGYFARTYQYIIGGI